MCTNMAKFRTKNVFAVDAFARTSQAAFSGVGLVGAFSRRRPVRRCQIALDRICRRRNRTDIGGSTGSTTADGEARASISSKVEKQL